MVLKSCVSILFIPQPLKHPQIQMRAVFNSPHCWMLKFFQKPYICVNTGLEIYTIMQTWGDKLLKSEIEIGVQKTQFNLTANIHVTFFFLNCCQQITFRAIDKSWFLFFHSFASVTIIPK